MFFDLICSNIHFSKLNFDFQIFSQYDIHVAPFDSGLTNSSISDFISSSKSFMNIKKISKDPSTVS